MIVDVRILRSGIAHRADDLACDNRIADRDMPCLGMQDLVKKAVPVPDRYSADRALSGIFHNAVYWRA